MSNEVPEFGWKTARPECSAPYVVPVLKRLASAVAPPARVLDIGCGNGYNSNQYKDWGYDVTGIDYSEEGISIARQQHEGIRFESMPIADDLADQLGGERFDIVSSTEVCEHLYDPHEWARAAFNALRPGGIFVLSTPYHGFIKNLTISLTGGWDTHFDALRTGGHIKFFSNKTLGTVLTDAGFEDFTFVGAGRAPLLWKSILVRARKPASTG